MKLSRWKALGGFFLAAVLSTPAMGDNTALPGTLNYIEGQASIQTQPLTPKSVGSADLQPGQTLTTQNGRAEVLLTPGVFLRLDDSSAVKMISPSLTHTQVELDQGRAEVEVAEIHEQNNIEVTQGNATTRLVKKGLYAFSSDPDRVRVFKGEAHVAEGDHTVKVKGGHELQLNSSAKLKPKKFDKDAAKGDFYNWSKLRSEYLSEASANAAQIYVNNGWVGSGWYWDPLYSGYTFIPGAGIAYSPFGWGFYSPGIYPYGGYYGGLIFGGDRDHNFYRGHAGDADEYHGPNQGFFKFHPAAPHAYPNVGGLRMGGGFHDSPGFGGEGHIGGFHGGDDFRGGGSHR
jgi:hypothetical protein